jgi:hypothetical protein
VSRLILHVGPGKCGSSSIQGFFASEAAPCRERTRFALLDPRELFRLECRDTADDASDRLAQQISDASADSDAVILSQEALFKLPGAVASICRLASALGLTTTIVGYSRRQADFIVSAYSQWLFRSPDRAREASTAVADLGLEPALFSGVERHLIAAIVTDFATVRQLSGHSILDWHAGYCRIARLVEPTGAAVAVGQLPRAGSSTVSLIDDFCARCALTLAPELRGRRGPLANIRFEPDLVEAIHDAVSVGFEMPGPHDRNAEIAALSAALAPAHACDSRFFADLRAYVDGRFFASNTALCRDFDLPVAYFEPSRRITRDEIIGTIHNEHARRHADPTAIIERYRRLSARLAALLFRP